MKWSFVYGFIPIPIFYTHWGIPERFGGVFRAFLILIRPKYRDDKGLEAHELTHARQFWRNLGLPFTILYQLSRRARLKWEVEGYREQIRHYPAHRIPGLRMTFARFLAEKYRLGISPPDAHRVLWG